MTFSSLTPLCASSRAIAGVAAVAIGAACTGAHAQSLDARLEPRHRVAIDDADPHAVYELRDRSDRLVAQCLYPCSLSAPDGEYRVVAVHGGARDELEIGLDHDLRVRGRKASYVGVALGVPVVVAGAVTALAGVAVVALAGSCISCDDDSTAQLKQAQADAGSARVVGAVVVALGVAGIVGGIALIGSSHGASLAIDERAPTIRSLSLSAAPTLGGGAFALTGSF